MSLAVLADHMASKGRGPDSMLIHMSPREVQGLQALAENHGGSLTINPKTGLPEAGFLDKLLPTIIGAGISFFSGGTIDPMTAAAMVGGVETARTGDLGRGISAGLGAYGGASLTAGMSTTGSAAMGTEAGALAGNEAATWGASQLTDAGANVYNQAQLDALKRAAIDEGTLQQGMSELTGKTTTGELLSKGADVAKANPMQYLKDNAKPLMYAAGPAILAAASAKENMPKTVTQPGMIRPYSYNPYSGGFVGGNPYEAQIKGSSEGGLMGMAAGGMAGYGDGDDVPRRIDDGMAQGGMYEFAQRSEPVLRMAEGGIAGYATGGAPTILSDADLFAKTGSWEAAAAARDAQNNAMNQYTWQQQADARDQAARASNIVADADRLRAATNTNVNNNAVVPVDYNALATNYVTTAAANPNITTSDFITGANTAKIGLTQPLATALQNSGLSLGSQYALTHADIGDAANAEETYGGLKGLSSNINYSLAQYNADAANKNKTSKQKQEDALAALGKYGLNEADVKRATGRTLAELFPTQLVCGPGFKLNAAGTACVPDTTVVTPETQCPTGYHYDPVLKQCVLNTSATQTTTTNVGTPTNISTAAASSLPVGISGAGITTINPNGTITTRPDLSLEMSTVRDAYTKGGGSLGYTSPVPTSYADFEKTYNKLTGGSKQSYDYLTGKTKYSPIPDTPTGEVMKPYAESVLGMKLPTSSKMYLFDPVTKQYKINPDYAIPTYDSKGVKSTNLTNKDVTAYMDKNPSTADFYTWATTNNLSVDQIAAATGRPINEISKLYTGAKALTGEDGKIDQAKVDEKAAADEKANFDATAYLKANQDVMDELNAGKANFGTKEDLAAAAWEHYQRYGKAQKRPLKAKEGGLMAMARGGMAAQFNLGDYSDGGRLLRGPGDGVSDSIPASIGNKRPARLADGEFVVPARIVSELGNGSTEAGARKLYAMMDRVQAARRSTVGRGRVAKNSRADKYLPA